MACLDYTKVGISPVVPVVEDVKPVLRERMLHCEYFGLWRLSGESEFTVGEAGAPRVLVCIAGEGLLKHQGASHAFRKGDALLLPAIVGPCLCMPFGEVTLLEISLPDGT
jgi:mannose-6-phosphate isomerase class I